MQSTLPFKPTSKRPADETSIDDAPRRRNKTQVTLPPPPEYTVCSPDTPMYYGNELLRYVENVASTRSESIPFVEYLNKRLSDEHMNWYTALLSARLGSDEKYHIDLDDLWPMLEYSRKDNATKVLEEKYRKDTDYFLPRDDSERKTGRGGHNQKHYLLTFECARKFASRAGTSVGKRVSDFFVRIQGVSEEFLLIDAAIRSKANTLGAVHDVLLREYDGKDIIYVAFIGHLDDETDLKSIGHTGDIRKRAREQCKKYGNFKLTHAVQSPHKHKCEQGIFHHPLVAPMRDLTIVDGDQELFRVPRKQGSSDSLYDVINTVAREVRVSEGGNVAVHERQIPKTPEEMAHEIHLKEMDERMLDKKHEHEIRVLEMKLAAAPCKRKPPVEPEVPVDQAIKEWWNECTMPAGMHIPARTLLASWVAFSGDKNASLMEFNKKLRGSGVVIKKGVRTKSSAMSAERSAIKESPVATGVERRDLVREHPSFTKIDWETLAVTYSKVN